MKVAKVDGKVVLTMHYGELLKLHGVAVKMMEIEDIISTNHEAHATWAESGAAKMIQILDEYNAL